MSGTNGTTGSAVHLIEATIDRLSGVLRTLELTRADDSPADPDLILILEDVVADQITALQEGGLPILDPLGELSRKPAPRETQKTAA
jgi:hypothetical protein